MAALARGVEVVVLEEPEEELWGPAAPPPPPPPEGFGFFWASRLAFCSSMLGQERGKVRD